MGSGLADQRVPRKVDSAEARPCPDSSRQRQKVELFAGVTIHFSMVFTVPSMTLRELIVWAMRNDLQAWTESG